MWHYWNEFHSWSCMCASLPASRYQLYRQRERGKKGRIKKRDQWGGGRASLIDFCICRARWRNVEKRDWHYHVGGNSLRKHLAALLRYQPGVLLCYHFSPSSGESASAEVNLITRLIHSGMCMLKWPTMSPKENRKVRDTSRVFFSLDTFLSPSRPYRFVARTISNISTSWTPHRFLVENVLGRLFF